MGAPAWAALVAIVDSMRASAGRSTLDGPSQTLPAIYSLPNSDFHQIGGGYNDLTGRGSPVANLLVPALAVYGTTASTNATTQSAAGTNAVKNDPIGSVNAGSIAPTDSARAEKNDRSRFMNAGSIAPSKSLGSTSSSAAAPSPVALGTINWFPSYDTAGSLLSAAGSSVAQTPGDQALQTLQTTLSPPSGELVHSIATRSTPARSRLVSAPIGRQHRYLAEHDLLTKRSVDGRRCEGSSDRDQGIKTVVSDRPGPDRPIIVRAHDVEELSEVRGSKGDSRSGRATLCSG